MHDPQSDAARYLGDVLPPGERDLFARHLLTCPDCWQEVDEARRGRALVEAQRVVAPVVLRERIRALAQSEPVDRSDASERGGGSARPAADPSRDRSSPAGARREASRRWVLLPVAACLAGVLGVAVVHRTAEPAALREAVGDYVSRQLPGAGVPEGVAPDLSALSLQPVGAGGGSYAGLEVDGYAYRDPAGRRVVLYLSDEPFPEAPGAQRLAGTDGAWIVDRGDVVVLCARVPHGLLVVGQDRTLVRRAAASLGVL